MSAPLPTMEVVVAVSIAVLAAIFLASLVALLIVCSTRICRKTDHISRQQRESRPDVNLVEHMEGVPETTITSDLELDDVGFNSNLEQILDDETWVNDATGLVPHCIAILKTCHNLTEKMVGMTMGNSQQLRTPETLMDIVSIAKRISPRVDDVVKSMYPPLDPRLLEARCTALVLSVSHLVLVTKNACRMSGVMDWIDQSLADVEDHLKVLREASITFEMHPQMLDLIQPSALQTLNGNHCTSVSSPNLSQPSPQQSPPQRSESSEV